MASDLQVRLAVRAVLPTVDFEVTNERQIREIVSQRLGGADMTPKKLLIREEIELYVMELDASCKPQGAQPAPLPGSQVPIAQQHRQQQGAAANAWAPKRPAPAAAKEEEEEEEDAEYGKAAARPAKMARIEGGCSLRSRKEGDEVLEVYLDLPGPKRISVGKYKEAPRIDFRKYYEDKVSGELKPSKDGISIPLEGWAQLTANVAALDQAMQRKDTNFRVQLTPKVRAQPSSYKAAFFMDIRETFTTKEGEEATTKKGLALGADQWATFVAHVPFFSEAVTCLEHGEPLPGYDAAPAAAAGARAKPEEGGAGAAGHIGTTPTGEWFLSLTPPGARNTRRITVGKYKGSTSINVREFYQKGGEFLPGQVGLNLGMEGWTVVYDKRHLIQAAVAEGREMTDALGGGGSRMLLVQKYNGKSQVAFREFYTDKASGELRPGKKGINLSGEQWAVLYANIEAVGLAVQRAG